MESGLSGLERSQIHSEPSLAAAASLSERGEKATAFTAAEFSVSGRRINGGEPRLSISHKRTVPSSLAEANLEPSLDKETDSNPILMAGKDARFLAAAG